MNKAPTANHEVEYVRIPRVEKMTGISKSSIWRLARAGKFPRPIKLSERVTAWDKAEIVEWMTEKKAER